MRVHRSIDGFDATRPLAPWISRIAYNACLRRLERKAANAASMVDPKDLQSRADGRAPDPERAAQSREAGRLIESLMDDLSAQDRALMVLRYREGLADAEVAEAVGMPVNTVKTRIFRARARLRTGLAPHLGRKPDTR
jgi:RNA polymerase sigma-70 factor (ECF subfamily)